MKTTLTECDFRNAFEQLRPDNFSYEGITALFYYFEDLEDDIGEEMELDVIAICCDFSEYESVDELLSDYSSYESLDEIRDNAVVIELDNGGVIIQAF